MNELADQTGSTDTGKAADRLAGKLCDFYEVCSQNAVQNKLKASLFFGHVFSCHRRSAPSIPGRPNRSERVISIHILSALLLEQC